MKRLILGMALSVGLLANSFAAPVPVPAGSVWRFLDDGSNQGAAWTAPAFNDGSWSSGPGQLGYGDDDEATVVGFGTNSQNKFVTTYFRHQFVVTNPELIEDLRVAVLSDDGAIVYLNGTEIFRNNLPAGTITYATLALVGLSSPEENGFVTNSVNSALLVDGANTLAVEVHQFDPTSADIGFDLTLLHARVTGSPRITLTAPTNDSVFTEAANVSLAATASDPGGFVASVEFFRDGISLGQTALAPYGLTWTNAPGGIYRLTAVATDNQGLAATSSAVYIEVRGGGSVNLVSTGALWKYLDTGVNQGTNWRQPAFSDSAWREGLAKLGYGEGDEATTVSYGLSAGNRYITTYFRKTFYVVDPSGYDNLTLRLLRDDGAVVYLNSTEVVRANMPTGAVVSSTLATANVSGANESTYFIHAVSPIRLVAGHNVLAVEIHQVTAASADLGFDLGLSANRGAPEALLVRGPYLQSATTNSGLVRWRTDRAVRGRLFYGTDLADLSFISDGATITNEHILSAANLDPDTKYYYAIGTSAGPMSGGDTNHYFRTLPPPGPARPTRIWALGDSGTASSNARSVRDGYLGVAGDEPLDVWLMLGDNAYNTGQDAEYQAAVFDMYPTILRRAFLWPTIGNHDSAFSESANQFPYLDIFSLPVNGEAGGLASGTEKYYSFDYANIHFVCLDAMTSDRSTNSAMFTWLRDDLAATPQEWIIAYWHHPPYTKGSHDSDTEGQLIQMRMRALPILEAGGVDLVLCGHSHCYERSFLLEGHYGLSGTLDASMVLDAGDGRDGGDGPYVKAPNDSAHRGTVYVVAGSSGQTSGGPLNHPAMFISLNNLGSLMLNVEGPRLDAVFLRETGQTNDVFTILKGTPSNQAPEILSIERQNGSTLLTWSSVADRVYQIQFRTSLTEGDWLDLPGQIVAEGSVTSGVDGAPLTTQRFYRVVGLW